MSWYESVTGGGGNSFALGDAWGSGWTGDMSTTTAGGQTWVSDAWSGAGDFLTSGMNIWKDYMTISGKGAYEVPAAGSYDQWAERAQPADTQAANATATGGGQLVPGVGNGVLLLAGAALAVVLLTTKK